jgi:hypothetical protein
VEVVSGQREEDVQLGASQGTGGGRGPVGHGARPLGVKYPRRI